MCTPQQVGPPPFEASPDAHTWVLDTGATSHMSSSDGILLTRLPPSSPFIIVGNGQSIPVISRGTFTLPIADASFSLNNVLVAPALVIH